MSYKKSDFLLAAILTVFLISAAIVIAVFEPFIFRIDLDLYNLGAQVGLARDAVLENYQSLIKYQSLLHSGPLVMPDFVMSQSGRIHFEEVKNIFVAIQLTALATGLASLIGVALALRKREYRFLNLSSYLVVVIPSLIGIVAIGDFDRTFLFFHQLVFNNDYWIFDASTDPVIGILPEHFFYHKLILIIVLVFLFAGIMKLAYLRFKSKIIKDNVIS